MTRPVLREQDAAWELRTAWALGREVVLRLDAERCTVPRVRGTVSHVAPTGAFVLMRDEREGDLHVPCSLILAIRRPHFTEPLDAPEPSPEEEGQLPGQLRLGGGWA